jgi:hypothetical protein
MLSQQNSFFPANKNKKTITIFADSMHGDVIGKCHDDDDQSMQAMIDHFEMVDYRTMEGTLARRAVFHMRDADLFEINLISLGKELTSYNKACLFAQCAIRSILKKLHEHGCINNHRTIYQAYHEDAYHDKDNVSDIYGAPIFIPLNLASKESKEKYINKKFLNNYTISTTHAYLSTKELWITFNKMDENQERKISTVLTQFFQKKEPTPSLKIGL